MGRLREHVRNLSQQIFPHLKRGVEKHAEKIKHEVKKKLKTHGAEIMSEAKRHYSGSKTKTIKKDYSQDHHAKLSSLAYEKDLAKKKREARRLGYDLDEELSTDNHSVFKHRQSGKGIIAYRGTDPKNTDDLLADKDIALGQRNHKRFNEALHVGKRAQKKYKELELTGHSLGGTQALHVYEVLGVRTRVFNPGSTPKGQKLKKHSSGVTPEIIRHEDDVISLGYAPHATETYRTGDFEIPDLLKAHNIPGQK